jgi:hypothetical protein
MNHDERRGERESLRDTERQREREISLVEGT